MADAKTYAQWTQNGSGLSVATGLIVEVGEGVYALDTTATEADAAVTDVDGVPFVDTETTTGLNLVAVSGKVVAQ